MTYTFESLSPADFEDLTLDLIGRLLSVRFEAFASGPDSGIDGRYSKGNKDTILQSKHYVNSTFSALKSAMKKERASIDKLKPSRYILATSRSLTPGNKDELSSLIGPVLVDKSDILSQADLNRMLSANPDIEKSHIKLWLGSAAVLDRVLRAAAHSVNLIAREQLEAKLKVYATNRSLVDAQKILEEHHILIISGAPGVGKTTLAQMISYAYMAENWEFNAINSLNDGFASLNDQRKQVFFFDDFLGKIALDAHSLASKDTDLANFMKKVQRGPNSRFVLTTRAYILEDARRMSEHLAGKLVEVTKFVLNVGLYTRKIKARILYNHLYGMNVPREFIVELLDSSLLTKIVDHKNYNPRIIEDMTDRLVLQDLKPEQYPKAFIDALDNPDRIWDHAFRNHISQRCRNLVYALYFSSPSAVYIEDLREFFAVINLSLSKKYLSAYSPEDFEESLKILEGSFISISDRMISFINPSIRDYIHNNLSNIELIVEIAEVCNRAQAVELVWRHALKSDRFSQAEIEKLVGRLEKKVNLIISSPQFKKLHLKENQLRIYDVGCDRRVNLLLSLWDMSMSDVFSSSILELCKIIGDGGYLWSDGGEIVDLIVELRSGTYSSLPDAEAAAASLEKAVLNLLAERMTPDDLETTYGHIIDNADYLSEKIIDSLKEAVLAEIENASDYIYDEDGMGALDNYATMIRSMGDQLGISETKIVYAEMEAKEKIKRIEESYDRAEAPHISTPLKGIEDRFSDADIQSLFSSLRH